MLVLMEGRYEMFLPLHEMWVGYMREVFGELKRDDAAGMHAKLAKADLHGSILTGE